MMMPCKIARAFQLFQSYTARNSGSKDRVSMHPHSQASLFFFRTVSVKSWGGGLGTRLATDSVSKQTMPLIYKQ